MPIELVWSAKLEGDFDLKRFASGLLERAQENLRQDGYVQSAVFLLTNTDLQCYSVAFSGYKEKEGTYEEVFQKAREGNAVAIVTLNDAYVGTKLDPDEEYEWGQVAADPKGECLFVTISGPDLENWTKEVQYRRGPDGLCFSSPVEERNALIGLLGEWSSNHQRAN